MKYLEYDEAVAEVGVEVVDLRTDSQGVHPVPVHLQRPVVYSL